MPKDWEAVLEWARTFEGSEVVWLSRCAAWWEEPGTVTRPSADRYKFHTGYDDKNDQLQAAMQLNKRMAAAMLESCTPSWAEWRLPSELTAYQEPTPYSPPKAVERTQPEQPTPSVPAELAAALDAALTWRDTVAAAIQFWDQRLPEVAEAVGLPLLEAARWLRHGYVSVQLASGKHPKAVVEELVNYGLVPADSVRAATKMLRNRGGRQVVADWLESRQDTEKVCWRCRHFCLRDDGSGYDGNPGHPTDFEGECRLGPPPTMIGVALQMARENHTGDEDFEPLDAAGNACNWHPPMVFGGYWCGFWREAPGCPPFQED